MRGCQRAGGSEILLVSGGIRCFDLTPMADESHLDAKNFVANDVYNCAFCKRRRVTFTQAGHFQFEWTRDKPCHIWLLRCNSCQMTSLHLSFNDISNSEWKFQKGIDLDANIFYSVPTSVFVLDSRIPNILRDLIGEAEGCLKMNFLTGASACTRKAIYELTLHEKAEGDNYDEQIKSLKSKHPEIPSELFDVLAHIKDMTSDKVHEQSWDKWDSKHLTLFIQTLKTILQELYVIPKERDQRTQEIRGLLQGVREKQKKSETDSSA